MVPGENVTMEKKKSHFLATQGITLWKLHHQNELIAGLKKFSAQKTNA